MNKQDNKLAFLVLATLTTGIGLIYTLIMYHDIFFAVVGMSALFLVAAFILTTNIITHVTMKNKSLNVQIRDCIDGISNQLEAMNGVQAQIGKATYLYTRKAAQSVATLENNYTESQEAIYKNLVSIFKAHNKATKLMIKYDQSNTTKLISTIKDLRAQLSDTMIQGFDQLQPDNTEIVNTLGDIVDYLKTQSGTIDQELGSQLTNIAQELQNVSSSIQKIQFTAPEKPQPVQQSNSIPAATPISVLDTETAVSDITFEESELELPEEEVTVNLSEMEAAADELDTEAIADMPEMEEETLTDLEETDISIPETAENPNAKMSDDEIAALFAAADPSAKIEPETAVDTAADEEEPFTPTFTVVGKSDDIQEEEEEPETNQIKTIGDLPDDPNKQLSPDEIAALFASAEPAPKKEEPPKPVVTEPVSAAPVSSDPNKQLSPDEIAALFAAAEPAPKKEPAKVQPVLSDPNKQLSPEEIAALFAASSS